MHVYYDGGITKLGDRGFLEDILKLVKTYLLKFYRCFLPCVYVAEGTQPKN